MRDELTPGAKKAFVLESRRASSRQCCRHAAGHARAHAARALLLTTLCARMVAFVLPREPW